MNPSKGPSTSAEKINEVAQAFLDSLNSPEKDMLVNFFQVADNGKNAHDYHQAQLLNGLYRGDLREPFIRVSARINEFMRANGLKFNQARTLFLNLMGKTPAAAPEVVTDELPDLESFLNGLSAEQRGILIQFLGLTTTTERVSFSFNHPQYAGIINTLNDILEVTALERDASVMTIRDEVLALLNPAAPITPPPAPAAPSPFEVDDAAVTLPSKLAPSDDATTRVIGIPAPVSAPAPQVSARAGVRPTPVPPGIELDAERGAATLKRLVDAVISFAPAAREAVVVYLSIPRTDEAQYRAALGPLMAQNKLHSTQLEMVRTIVAQMAQEFGEDREASRRRTLRDLIAATIDAGEKRDITQGIEPYLGGFNEDSMRAVVMEFLSIPRTNEAEYTDRRVAFFRKYPDCSEPLNQLREVLRDSSKKLKLIPQAARPEAMRQIACEIMGVQDEINKAIDYAKALGGIQSPERAIAHAYLASGNAAPSDDLSKVASEGQKQVLDYLSYIVGVAEKIGKSSREIMATLLTALDPNVRHDAVSVAQAAAPQAAAEAIDAQAIGKEFLDMLSMDEKRMLWAFLRSEDLEQHAQDCQQLQERSQEAFLALARRIPELARSLQLPSDQIYTGPRRLLLELMATTDADMAVALPNKPDAVVIARQVLEGMSELEKRLLWMSLRSADQTQYREDFAFMAHALRDVPGGPTAVQLQQGVVEKLATLSKDLGYKNPMEARLPVRRLLLPLMMEQVVQIAGLNQKPIFPESFADAYELGRFLFNLPKEYGKIASAVLNLSDGNFDTDLVILRTHYQNNQQHVDFINELVANINAMAHQVMVGRSTVMEALRESVAHQRKSSEPPVAAEIKKDVVDQFFEKITDPEQKRITEAFLHIPVDSKFPQEVEKLKKENPGNELFIDWLTTGLKRLAEARGKARESLRDEFLRKVRIAFAPHAPILDAAVKISDADAAAVHIVAPVPGRPTERSEETGRVQVDQKRAMSDKERADRAAQTIAPGLINKEGAGLLGKIGQSLGFGKKKPGEPKK